MSYRDAAIVITRHPELVRSDFIWRPDCPCVFCQTLPEGFQPTEYVVPLEDGWWDKVSYAEFNQEDLI